MRTHPDVGLMTEVFDRLPATYAFLAAYSIIMTINLCECGVNYIQMLMQWASIHTISILTMIVYCIISDHTDGKVIQNATNNVDACTHCAYLFLKHANKMPLDVIYSRITNYFYKMMNISANIKQNSFKLCLNIAICYAHTIFTLFVYNMVGFGIVTVK